MLLQHDAAQRLPRRAPVRKRRGDIDGRPAESREQAQRAGQVRQQQVSLLVPGEHGFDRELRQRLHPREHGQREPLRHEILRGFRGPGDHQRGEQDGRSGPQHRGGGWFPSTVRRRKGRKEIGDRRPGATRPWYNERMPGFRVETPQRAYDAIVERGSLARVAEFLPERAGKIFVVTTADVWELHGAKRGAGAGRAAAPGAVLSRAANRARRWPKWRRWPSR